MRYKNFQKNILRSLGLNFSRPLINVLCKTLMIEETNKSSINNLLQEGQNIIFAFWHGTMLAPWYVLKDYKPTTIISKSKDGHLLSNLLSNWNYRVRRGSSSKGGKEVLDELIEDANNNKSIAITPDGPRGPNKVMKAGTVIIAKKTNTPIILIGVGNKKRKTLKSWDQFEIPYPFSKVKIIYSEPIIVDPDLTYEETDKLIQTLSNKLNEIQKLAEQN